MRQRNELSKIYHELSLAPPTSHLLIGSVKAKDPREMAVTKVVLEDRLQLIKGTKANIRRWAPSVVVLVTRSKEVAAGCCKRLLKRGKAYCNEGM